MSLSSGYALFLHLPKHLIMFCVRLVVDGVRGVIMCWVPSAHDVHVAPSFIQTEQGPHPRTSVHMVTVPPKTILVVTTCVSFNSHSTCALATVVV